MLLCTSGVEFSWPLHFFPVGILLWVTGVLHPTLVMRDRALAARSSARGCHPSRILSTALNFLVILTTVNAINHLYFHYYHFTSEIVRGQLPYQKSTIGRQQSMVRQRSSVGVTNPAILKQLAAVRQASNLRQMAAIRQASTVRRAVGSRLPSILRVSTASIGTRNM